MMLIISHRINTIDELKETPTRLGVELDLRYHNEELILHHDPFVTGEKFEEYLKHYNHRFLILNIKSEGIEYRVLELLNRYAIKDYFFLDCSFPMIYKLANSNEKNIALRFSEFEGIDTLVNMQGKAEWVWLDCFNKLPIDRSIFTHIKSLGYKLCLVSPELQSQKSKIQTYINHCKAENIHFDAICCKAVFENIYKTAFSKD